MGRDFRFIAQGREFYGGQVSGPCDACEVARVAARKTPGVEHMVYSGDKLLAAYKLVGGRLAVRMP